MTDQPDPMTADEAAAYLRVDPLTVKRLLRLGHLPGAKVGKQWRIWRADLEAYLASGAKPQVYAPRKRTTEQ